MKIIINSDDLGISSRVNEAILGLMDQRRVTSATLMANAPAAEDAVRQMGRYKNCSFGVHLNLTQFASLSGDPGLAPLLDTNGAFLGITQHGISSVPLTKELKQGIYVEWCAQIESAFAMGVPVSHIDSHHHVHTRVGMLGVLRRIQQRFGIRKVRLRRNLAGTSAPMRIARGVVNNAWNFALRNLVHATTTDGFLAFAPFHERLRAGMRFKGTIEVMCHPGAEKFAAETELLRGDWKEKFERQVELISYNDLE
jgi:predicted glycoside hydrolase/deacetylase ChbG (UPF0249 family)